MPASQNIEKLSDSSDRLRPDCLSYSEVLAQSIASIAPTSTPAFNLPFVFAVAGNATWLAYVLATCGMLFVSFNLNQFAQRSASPGSLYTCIGKGLGVPMGALASWVLVFSYLCATMAALSAFSIYASALISLPAVLLFAVCAGSAWYCAHRDIQFSTLFTLGLEALSVGLILALAALILYRQGLKLDMAQLSLAGGSVQGVQLGLVLAVLSFAGFETATTLGSEARDPLRTIPKAIFWSTLLSGLFFLMLAYVEVLGFKDTPTSLAHASAPLAFLAEQAGMGSIGGVLLSLGAAISFFACALATINAVARIIMSLGQQGLLPKVLGRIHPQNRTPYIAVAFCSVSAFIVPTLLIFNGVALLDIGLYLGTLATYGFLLVYILISLAAPLHLYRLGELKLVHALSSGLGILFMLIPVVGSFYPVPPAPINRLPYLFLAVCVVGIVWFWWQSRQNQTIPKTQ